MQFEFAATPGSIRNCYPTAWRWKRLFRNLLVTTLLGTAISLLFWFLDLTLALLVGWIAFALLNVLLRRLFAENVDDENSEDLPVRVEISPSGLWTDSGKDGWQWFDWAWVRHVGQGKEGVAIKLNGANFYIPIPASAFKSPGEQQRLVDLVDQYRSDAKGRVASKNAPKLLDFSIGRPQKDIGEERYRLCQPNAPASDESGWLVYTIAIFGGLMLWLAVDEFEGVFQTIAGVLAFIALSFAATLAVANLNARRERKLTPRSDETCTTIATEGLLLQGNLSESFAPWSIIDEADCEDDQLHFIGDSGYTLTSIDLSLFDSPEEAIKFLSIVKEFTPCNSLGWEEEHRPWN